MRAVLAVFAAIALSSPVRADVVTLPHDVHEDEEDIGGIALVSMVRAPDDAECDETLAPPCSLAGIYAGWAPPSAPLQVQVRRDRTGYAIQLFSTLRDRRDSPLCLAERPLARSARAASDRLWAELRHAVEAWAPGCAPLRTIGVDRVIADFAMRESDFRAAFARMAAVPARRFSYVEDGVSLGTYSPALVTQGLLDAIADACEASRDRVRLRADGAIDWVPDRTTAYGADGTRPSDDCVDLQIRHFPGYPGRS